MIAPMPGVDGGCLCGAIRYRVEFPTIWFAHCHCSMCRRAHGAAFVSYCGVPEAQFRIETGADMLVRYDSSPTAWRQFCRRCGSTLTFAGERWPGEVHVVVANLNGPLDREPAAHCYYDAKVPWVDAADHLPRLGGPTGTQPL